VSGKTNGKIPKLLDYLSPVEVLFLINATYFKGKWRNAFDAKDTRDGPFRAADGQDRARPRTIKRWISSTATARSP